MRPGTVKTGIVAAALAAMTAGAVMAQSVGPVAGPGGPGTYGPAITGRNGHVQFGNGQPPVVSSCGTSPSTVAGTDAAFHFVTGTGASGACTITPAIPYALRPTCVFEAESSTQPGMTVSVTGVITLSSVQDATRYYGHCFAQPGGM